MIREFNIKMNHIIYNENSFKYWLAFAFGTAAGIITMLMTESATHAPASKAWG